MNCDNYMQHKSLHSNVPSLLHFSLFSPPTYTHDANLLLSVTKKTTFFIHDH